MHRHLFISSRRRRKDFPTVAFIDPSGGRKKGNAGGVFLTRRARGGGGEEHGNPCIHATVSELEEKGGGNWKALSHV